MVPPRPAAPGWTADRIGGERSVSRRDHMPKLGNRTSV